MQSHKILVAI